MRDQSVQEGSERRQESTHGGGCNSRFNKGVPNNLRDGRAERDRTADLFRVKEALIPTELRPYGEWGKIVA